MRKPKALDLIDQQIQVLENIILSNEGDLEELEHEIRILHRLRFNQALRISKIIKKKQRLCKHRKETYRRKNYHADPYFEYYIICKECEKWVAVQDFKE